MIWNDFWWLIFDWYLKDTSKKNRLAIFSELFLDRYGKKTLDLSYHPELIKVNLMKFLLFINQSKLNYLLLFWRKSKIVDNLKKMGQEFLFWSSKLTIFFVVVVVVLILECHIDFFLLLSESNWSSGNSFCLYRFTDVKIKLSECRKKLFDGAIKTVIIID